MPSSTPAPAIPVLTMPVEGEAVVAKKRKLPLIITGIVLAVLVVAAIAGFFTARWYFQDKAAPGVTFGGTSVAGQTADQLKNTVTAAVKNTTVNIKDGNGNNASGSLSDLGVSYNVDKTVTELLAAKHQTNGALEYINEVNPFVKKNVPLNAKSNKLALRTFVTDKFVQDTDRAVPSTASYDANARLRRSGRPRRQVPEGGQRDRHGRQSHREPGAQRQRDDHVRNHRRAGRTA